MTSGDILLDAPVLRQTPLGDSLGRGDGAFDIFSERETQIFRRARLEWIAERDAQCISAQTNRQRAMEARQAARNQFQNRWRDFLVGKIDIFGAERFGDG